MGRALLDTRIEEEDREEMSAGFQDAGDGLHIISPPRRRDCAEAGVLNDPVKVCIPFPRESKEIPLQVTFRPGGRMGAGDPQGCCRQIESRDLAFTLGSQRADIVAWTASGHQHGAAYRMTRQEGSEWWGRVSLVPGGLPGEISRLPVDGIRIPSVGRDHGVRVSRGRSRHEGAGSGIRRS